MLVDKIFFKTEDNLELFGLLHRPEFATEKIVIAVHGMASDCEHKRDDIFAKEFTNNKIAYFCFNNRGAHILKKTTKLPLGTPKINTGSMCENIYECTFDIEGAVNKMLECGYKEIYLLGHSLGSTKILFTHRKLIEEKNELLKCIKGVMLLSLVDLKDYCKSLVGAENFEKSIIDAKSKLGLKNEYIFDLNIPMTPETFLRFFDEEFHFPRYDDENYKYDILNEVSCPLFLRWGNVKDYISMPAEDLVKKVGTNLNNLKVDINFVDGANHSYLGKEEIVAKQMITFLKKQCF